MQRRSIKYVDGFPQVGVEFVLRPHIAAPPPPPPPPTPYYMVSGEVRLEGIPLDSADVAFSGDGVYTTDGNGTYVGTLVYGYTGSSAPSAYVLRSTLQLSGAADAAVNQVYTQTSATRWDSSDLEYYLEFSGGFWTLRDTQTHDLYNSTAGAFPYV